MKKIILLAIAIASTFTSVSTSAQTEKEVMPNFPKVDVSPMDVVLARNSNEEPMLRVLYSRPQKRDRKIFGTLIPYGKVWRTGANEANEITLYKDMRVGDKLVKAGTYSLFTIPEQNNWTVILNKKTNLWGAYDYEEQQDVVRITAPVRKSSNTIEALSMVFEPIEKGTNLIIGWDDRFVKVPFLVAE